MISWTVFPELKVYISLLFEDLAKKEDISNWMRRERRLYRAGHKTGMKQPPRVELEKMHLSVQWGKR